MSLITRTGKGSKLTIEEMDGNLTYLESNGFVDGEYSQTLIGTGAVLQMQPQLLAFDASIGLYKNISPTGGSGTGLIVDVEIIDGEQGGKFAEYIIVDGGSGYAVGDTVSIQNTDIGGITGTTDSELTEDDVDGTTTSTITVTNNDITLNTTTLTVPGSINVDGEITTSNIYANQGNFTNGVFAENLLIVSNLFGDTNINFGTLPTTDPAKPGQLWNDSGSLKISAGE
jgi:hypothetical protein